jgi:hypothetical protein
LRPRGGTEIGKAGAIRDRRRMTRASGPADLMKQSNLPLHDRIRRTADQAIEIACAFLAAEVEENPAVRKFLANQIALLIVRGEKNPIKLANRSITAYKNWIRRGDPKR